MLTGPTFVVLFICAIWGHFDMRVIATAMIVSAVADLFIFAWLASTSDSEGDY